MRLENIEEVVLIDHSDDRVQYLQMHDRHSVQRELMYWKQHRHTRVILSDVLRRGCADGVAASMDIPEVKEPVLAPRDQSVEEVTCLLNTRAPSCETEHLLYFDFL